MAPLALVVILLATVAQGKVYDRCELVRELSRPKHNIPPGDLATWVCIVEHESRYNTSAVGRLNADKSGDHGLFQISDIYWCSPPGTGTSCGLTCAQLEDDDIDNDVVCALTVHRAHSGRIGGGFTAWTVYKTYCSGDVSFYVQGCDTTNGTSQHPTSSDIPAQNPPSTFTTTSQPRLTYDTSSEYSKRPLPTKPFTPTKKPSRKPQSPTTKKPRTTRKPTIVTDTTSGRPHDNPDDKYIIDDTGKITLVNQISASQTSRSRQTSFPRRPPLTRDPDPSSAWHNIHHDPRFLDEYP
ncbi:lysozyme C-like [Macrosteles quadrilineatus]|uniref:lysozyme C-like n=1 Tax=Macrosteles quadrilineatus TaxID=74068 RepID=UPI0023E0AF5C|nr:lysozyme C-like [Macrosteles quadrilineatus]